MATPAWSTCRWRSCTTASHVRNSSARDRLGSERGHRPGAHRRPGAATARASECGLQGGHHPPLRPRGPWRHRGPPLCRPRGRWSRRRSGTQAARHRRPQSRRALQRHLPVCRPTRPARDGTARDGRSGTQPVAVGGDPDQVAVLDNFCWGDLDQARPARFARSPCRGTDGARTYRMPFISGKDSLFNEFDGEAIPGTLLISALGLARPASSGRFGWRRSVTTSGWSRERGRRRLACVGSSISAPLGCPPRLMTHCRVTGRSTLRSATARSPQPTIAGGRPCGCRREMAIAAWLGVSVVVPLDGLDPFTALVNEAPGRLVLSAARAPGRRGSVPRRSWSPHRRGHRRRRHRLPSARPCGG